MIYTYPKVYRTVVTTLPVIIIITTGLLLTRNLSILDFLFVCAILALTKARQYWNYASVSSSPLQPFI